MEVRMEASQQASHPASKQVRQAAREPSSDSQEASKQASKSAIRAASKKAGKRGSKQASNPAREPASTPSSERARQHATSKLSATQVGCWWLVHLQWNRRPEKKTGNLKKKSRGNLYPVGGIFDARLLGAECIEEAGSAGGLAGAAHRFGYKKELWLINMINVNSG